MLIASQKKPRQRRVELPAGWPGSYGGYHCVCRLERQVKSATNALFEQEVAERTEVEVEMAAPFPPTPGAIGEPFPLSPGGAGLAADAAC
jgi:hypothetical protein